MLCSDRIDISERIDVNKTSASKECDICHYLISSNKCQASDKHLSLISAASLDIHIEISVSP